MINLYVKVLQFAQEKKQNKTKQKKNKQNKTKIGNLNATSANEYKSCHFKDHFSIKSSA